MIGTDYFQPVTVKTLCGEINIGCQGRGKGGFVRLTALVGNCSVGYAELLTPKKAREIIRLLSKAVDSLDGGVATLPVGSLCSLCEQGNTVRAYGLRTVQFKSIGGAKNSWEKAVPLCKEHRRRFCRTWRYAPTA